MPASPRNAFRGLARRIALRVSRTVLPRRRGRRRLYVGAMRAAATILVLTAAAGLSGCLRRTLEITSAPAGARVYISDREVGRTPVEVPFTWYGDYDLIFRLDGYETLKTHANLAMPWYEVPPLDLLSACAPWTYHTRRHVHRELQPLALPSDAELLERAGAMRQRVVNPPEDVEGD